MVRLTLPAGGSLRAVAERLGVPLDQLRRYVRVHDVDAPLASAMRVEVPDALLRAAQRARPSAVLAPRHRRGSEGMNVHLALDIEQKRARLAGGTHSCAPCPEELEALDEARRVYRRFEEASNELAAKLYKPLTTSLSAKVRATAFSGLACAYAQQHLLFGQEAAPLRGHSLSAARAALLAEPKLGEAHLAMGLALQLGDSPKDLEEASKYLERAAELEPANAQAWAALAALLERLGESALAQEVARRAVGLDPECPLVKRLGEQLGC